MMNFENAETESAQSPTYFSHGKKPDEVMMIFANLSKYLEQHLRSIVSSDWQHILTSDYKQRETILSIYQLKSNLLGLTVIKTIQMFMDQTIRIDVHSKECSKLLLDDLKIESPEDLKQLIIKVAGANLCTGFAVTGSENLRNEILRGVVRKSKLFFAYSCPGIICKGVKGQCGSVCNSCRKAKKALNQRKRRAEEKGKRPKRKKKYDSDSESETEGPLSETIKRIDESNSNSTPMDQDQKHKPNLKTSREAIQEKLETVWHSLGFDDAVRKWKENQEKEYSTKIANKPKAEMDNSKSITSSPSWLAKEVEGEHDVVLDEVKSELCTSERDDNEEELLDLVS